MGKKGLSLLSKVFNHELFTVFVFIWMMLGGWRKRRRESEKGFVEQRAVPSSSGLHRTRGE
jgi:hypothetical protein